jgi:hypothetical protein
MGRLTELLAAAGGTVGTVCGRKFVVAGVTFGFGLKELVWFAMTEGEEGHWSRGLLLVLVIALATTRTCWGWGAATSGAGAAVDRGGGRGRKEGRGAQQATRGGSDCDWDYRGGGNGSSSGGRRASASSGCGWRTKLHMLYPWRSFQNDFLHNIQSTSISLYESRKLLILLSPSSS